MRKSGILMHITSLPNSYGIGSVGKCAYEFVDFLRKTGQSYWQILPLSPTGYGDSPYQSFSTFAGNHYLIDLDMLIGEGLLKQEEADAICWSRDESRVDYGCLYSNRSKLLRLAYGRFTPDEAFEKFVSENADWLEDYALFMSLKEAFHGSACARMNFPGTLSAGNWTWRAPKGFITEELTKRMFDTTRLYGRL